MYKLVQRIVEKAMKCLYNLMFKYAMKHETIDKDYAALCKLVKKKTASRQIVPFSDMEIKQLWDSIEFPYVDMVFNRDIFGLATERTSYAENDGY